MYYYFHPIHWRLIHTKYNALAFASCILLLTYITVQKSLDSNERCCSNLNARFLRISFHDKARAPTFRGGKYPKNQNLVICLICVHNHFQMVVWNYTSYARIVKRFIVLSWLSITLSKKHWLKQQQHDRH